jgi:serine/threonine-protein kinase HSL1, negative regulator of Swe1 kinase
LFNYREKRLENYVGDLTHSASDYHHLRPVNWTKKFTTLEFPARYGRTPSRFTVISTVATDENGVETATDGGTIQSYDPYKSSRIMGSGEASHAHITVHRNGSMMRSSTRATLLNGNSMRSSSTYSRRGGRSKHLVVPSGMRSSQRSLASIRSAGSTPYTRTASRHKRGVNFSHSHRHSIGNRHDRLKMAPASIAGDDSTYDRDHTSPARNDRVPRRGQATARAETQSMIDFSTPRGPPVWREELYQFSDSIAKDCDQAFNSSLVAPNSYLGDSALEPSTVDSTMMDYSGNTKSIPVSVTTAGPYGPVVDESKRGSYLWDARPLPPAPPPSDSVLDEIMVAKKKTAQRRVKVDDSPGHVDRMMQHLDNLASGHASSNDDRRTSSAPIYSQYSTQWGKDTIPLPSIHEGQQDLSGTETTKQRVVSAPTGNTPIAASTPNFLVDRNGLDYLSKQENTIRMVMSPSNQSPVRAPAPLNVRKKPSRGLTPFPPVREEVSLRQQYVYEETRKPILEEPSASLPHVRPGHARKKSSWFKRASNDKTDVVNSETGSISSQMKSFPQTQSDDSLAGSSTRSKRKNFSFAFWRSSKEQNPMKLSLAGKTSPPPGPGSHCINQVLDVDFDDCPSPSPEPARMFSHPARPVHNGTWRNDVSTRNIEPQQSWLARLFRVKPATGHLCFTIPRRRARQEIAILLKEWRRYGIRDVQVDKDRNIVFGRVGPKNCMYYGVVV